MVGDIGDIEIAGQQQVGIVASIKTRASRESS